ncbi:unnamed protein product [Symbiodinium sp. CCMP2592]|nr:unnamed protein product [Symbiodinium sp. CCMP2592]CAE7337748.1 unnamed protein product [Symbiodinium sp. CCMP2592]
MAPRRDAASRKASVKKRQADKLAARRAAKESKLQKKAEKTFAKSVATYQQGSFERVRAFVDQQLDDNPAWIRPLADLMRDGAIKAILKMGSPDSAQAAGAGGKAVEKWQGRAKTWGELPIDAVLRMLGCVGVDINEPKVDDGTIDEQTIRAFFEVQFFVDGGVNLPAGCRAYETLEAMARQRFENLNLKIVQPKLEASGTLECFALAENGEMCCMHSDSTATLPGLSGDDKWVLSDASSPSCVVYSESNPSVSFSCRSLFDEVRGLDPAAKWTVSKKDS